jgi:hypothetical protein
MGGLHCSLESHDYENFSFASATGLLAITWDCARPNSVTEIEGIIRLDLPRDHYAT